MTWNCIKVISLFIGRYKEVKGQLVSKTGTGTDQKNKFREFDRLDEILGTRPGYNISGVDSSSSQSNY